MSDQFTPRLFHGGVPGLAPGGILRSAKHLNLPFNNTAYPPGTKYNPARVYLTTEVDQARAFASKYMDRNWNYRPGDVYEVQARGQLEGDPDFQVAERTKGVFLMTTSAVIVDVIERHVQIGEDELWRIHARHSRWAPDDVMAYDEDGHLQMSKPMAANGVSPQWLAMIRPWFDGTKLRHSGRLVASNPRELEDALFDALPQLDTGHLIVVERHFGLAQHVTCSECKQSFGKDVRRAATHQLGEAVVSAVGELYVERGDYLGVLVGGAQRRNPDRWGWFNLDTER